MESKDSGYDAIAEHLFNSVNRIRTSLGICIHEYKEINRIKIEKLSLKTEDLSKIPVKYLSRPTLIVSYKCKYCKKIKENHFIEVRH